MAWFGSVYGVAQDIAEGSATLVAGTVTVSDTKITANSKIRAGHLTVGGTPGAIFVGAKVAGTSFVLTSTSSTDTSVCWYEIVSY
jgi:hypothetical protein